MILSFTDSLYPHEMNFSFHFVSSLNIFWSRLSHPAHTFTFCFNLFFDKLMTEKINYDAIFKILNAQKIDWYWYSTFSKDEAKFSNKWLHTEFNENYKEYAYDCHWRKSCTQLVDEKIYFKGAVKKVFTATIE